MVYDSCFKKGDLVEIMSDVPKLKRNTPYKINHVVSKYHDNICVWLNENNKIWTLIKKSDVRKVG